MISNRKFDGVVRITSSIQRPISPIPVPTGKHEITVQLRGRVNWVALWSIWAQTLDCPPTE